jgi:hypothetical protein
MLKTSSMFLVFQVLLLSFKNKTTAIYINRPIHSITYQIAYSIAIGSDAFKGKIHQFFFLRETQKKSRT